MAAFSIGSWSFHALFETGKMSLFGYLESIKYRYRLNQADIWNGMLLSTEEDYILSIKQTLDEEGLTVANLSVDGADVWNDDPAVREQNHRKALLYLDIARKWGVQTLRIDLGVNTMKLSDEQFEFCVKRYSEYVQFAHDHGFRVGPQTHQPATLVPQNLKRICNEISMPGFGIILNVSRWLVDKEIGDEMVSPFTAHVQLDRAFVDFSGSELIQKVQLLRNGGYQGCWSLEYRGGANEYLEVERDLLTLRHAIRLGIGEY
ncbi:sugar phosphate isomerase/epimerase [Paenibacillus alkaliterrae]|uniref:sugar phosphate isomerase/epimerase family protein n=1 Tax=Paenibacillus alkaliterrae TaxID=320909 RepID=UPI001F401398|nr:TIM barrel protein [Paenibacillus alkaliterrae]MCF2941574.1 sugar phosphate isomerase/epimerase [Paenibacillus alkaliterrae]